MSAMDAGRRSGVGSGSIALNGAALSSAPKSRKCVSVLGVVGRLLLRRIIASTVISLAVGARGIVLQSDERSIEDLGNIYRQRVAGAGLCSTRRSPTGISIVGVNARLR